MGQGYYCTYCMLDDTSGDSGINVSGNMVSIGSELDWTPQLHVTTRGKEVPRVVLSQGKNALGFIPQDVFARVKKCLDEGWTCRAYATLVVFNKLEDRYLIEVAILCYEPSLAGAMDVFADRVRKRIAKGERPGIALSEKELSHLLEAKGEWAGAKPQPQPKIAKGSAVYKDKQTRTEALAFAAAAGNKGCYVGLAAATLVIVAAIAAIVWLVVLR